ncbi:MAG: glutamine-hydrolyzing carbamoyl-phosphate synthase small subunit [Lachnospiraceae bacterium]|nr:glutamine-hydrolyzing carbamoyl-phosphate synthase small subunit [Lachnospiraceae bacterium]
MRQNYDRKIVFEDGTEVFGYGFGERKDAVLEIVFNTSMAGYQEILSDPSYTDQAVVMTYPLIGNYGMADDDYETEVPTIGGLIVREYNADPSNFRSREPLGAVMERFGIPGISGVDTRMLTRSIRDHGSRKVYITDVIYPKEACLEILREREMPKDAVARVSRKEIRVSRADPESFRVTAIDCGMKENIVRSMNRRGMTVTIVPWNTPAEEIVRTEPDGVFLSNGPGDPEDVPETIGTVRRLLGRYPLFGICLGHQILALACGAKTYKLKFGHRGGNHPVMDLTTGKIEITSQNHSYAVDEASLAGTGLIVTHRNLLDGTVEGMRCEKFPAFSVQYHPESAPGPQDSAHLFDRFLRMMREAEGGERHA